MDFYENIIIGGGLGGLVAAHQLAKQNRKVLLIEKKAYPFHRVCGEYISNEVKRFLLAEGLFPAELNPTEIKKFRLTSLYGKVAEMNLDMGGFGISRFAFDQFLYQKAIEMGAEFLLQTQVEDYSYNVKSDSFEIELNRGEKLQCRNLIGAFGKRSKIDKVMDRSFMQIRTPFIGVKYHVKTDHESDIVALHNFEAGYCGINKIENDLFNICYLGSKHQLREFGNIEEMEKAVLYQNPHLKHLFLNSEFLFEKPEVINEVNFAPKLPVENHILMIGDAAGLITPLCGNGMAIAIHTGKLAADAILQQIHRAAIEKQYYHHWKINFKNRLWVGRKVQWLFGSKSVSEISVNLIKKSPFVANQILKRTHGKSF
jgi:menaquinone-9 beta-reductase